MRSSVTALWRPFASSNRIGCPPRRTPHRSNASAGPSVLRSCPRFPPWVSGFVVGVLLAGVVAKHPVLALVLDYVLGDERDLSPAVGCIYHVVRDGKSRSVAAQRFDDGQPGGDGRAEVADPLREIALVDVVGAHPHHEE